MIKTIIFDLGGVLFTKGTQIAIAKVSDKYNIPKEKVVEVFKGKLGSRYRVGAFSRKEFWRRARKTLGKDADLRDISHIWSDSYKPAKQMFQLLKRLKKRGYELLYLSNNIKERADHLDRKYHFRKLFDDGIFSYEAKIKKPDMRLVKMILKRAKSRPEECLFVDDSRENLVPAKKIGMKVTLFNDPSSLGKKLKAIGIMQH